MATTKNSRIRKHIAAITKKLEENKTVEAPQPYTSKMWNHTARKKNEAGEMISTKATIIIIDNTYGRIKRRKIELERLIEALKGASKKSRMKKFAHKQSKKSDDKQPRKKKGKG